MPHNITNADWHRRLQLSTGFKGRSGVPHLDTTIQPVVVVDDLREIPDPVQGIARYMTSVVATGDATHVMRVDFFNPDISKILRLDEVWVGAQGTTQLIGMQLVSSGFSGTPLFTGIGIDGAQDQRGFGRFSSVGCLTSLQLAVPTPNMAQFMVANGTTLRITNLRLVFPENAGGTIQSQGLSFSPSAVGVTTTVYTLLWSEFPVAPRG